MGGEDRSLGRWADIISHTEHKNCPCCGTGKALFSTANQPACDSCMEVMSRGGYPQFAKKIQTRK